MKIHLNPILLRGRFFADDPNGARKGRLSRLWQHSGRAVWVAVVVMLLAACGTPEIQPLSFEQPVWNAGEISHYTATNSGGDRVGTLRFDIEPGPGGEGWQIRRAISGVGIDDVVSVQVQGVGYRPQTAQLVRLENGGREQILTTYAGSRADLELTTRQDVTTYERISITSDVRDEATLLMLVRALPLAERYATRLNVFTPIMGSMERMTVQVNGREEVTTPMGTYEAWRVTIVGRDRDRRIEAWIGVEAPHPVVKFVDGRNRGTFELIEFESGTP